MSDLGQSSIVLPILLIIYSPNPSALALLASFPCAALNLYYACEAACAAPAVGALLGTHLAPRLTAYLVPSAAGASGEDRRKRLVQGLVEAGARYEIYAVLVLLGLLLTPLRNFGLTLSLATLLYSKFIFNEPSRRVWKELDGSTRGVLQATWVPAAVGAPLQRGYEWASAFAYQRATGSLQAAQERAQSGGAGAAGAAAAASCSVQ